MRRILVLIVVVAAGCSGGSKHSAPPGTAAATPKERAADLCRNAISGTTIAFSYPTTIEDFRHATIGTVGPSQTHRFPNLAPNIFGAWCWTGRPAAYNVYEVTVDGAKMLVASGMVGNPTDSNGRPSVP